MQIYVYFAILIIFAGLFGKMKVSNLIYAVIVLLISVSCSRPEPYGDIPEVGELAAVINGNSVTLTAFVSGSLDGIRECGFMWGPSEADMSRVKTSMNGRSLSVMLADLDWNTTYLYVAYVGNGRNEVTSSVRSFRTAAEPAESPDVPDGPDTPADPTVPVDPVVPESPVFEISCTEMEFSGTCESCFISVNANVEYEVVIPDDAPWLICTEKTSSRCCLNVDYNYSEKDRSCEVTLRSLEHECSHILTVRQRKIPVYMLHVPHTEIVSHTYFLPEFMQRPTSVQRIDDEGNKSLATWVAAAKLGDVVGITVRENRYDELRSEKVLIQHLAEDGDLATIILKVIQHPSYDLMDFECPEVEKRCVELWDADGDGHISYAEAAAVDSVPERAFASPECTSFDTFPWFTGLTEIPPYMFASAGLTSIYLPSTITMIGAGAFYDCASLDTIILFGGGPVLTTVSPTALDGTSGSLSIYLPWQWEGWYLDHIPQWERKTVPYGR